MMPAIDSTPLSSAITHISGVSAYSRPSSASTVLAVMGAAHDEIAGDLGGVEDVQRPAAVEGDVVGDVDQRVDRPQPDRQQPLLQPFRRRPVVDAAHQPEREAAAERRRVAEIERHLDRRLALPGTGWTAGVFSLPSPEAARSRAMP